MVYIMLRHESSKCFYSFSFAKYVQICEGKQINFPLKFINTKINKNFNKKSTSPGTCLRQLR